MGIYTLTLATVLYVLTSISYLNKKDYPHFLIWLAYSVANIGFLWHMMLENKQINENL